ncbi:hypothetical protein MLD38_010475 [Melastoma candidum]|uniref:Uncharacterized protein n=1 Tax=Melastoma candidum TaxID=119954 RepID=A0ACB9R191_9MYRT|nr:hypothetical protein MLD38_010475 [Melastoma candidum]
MNSSRKRQAVSNPNPDSIDSSFWNKRVMGDGSTFDAQRARPPATEVPGFTTMPALDAHRAELSRQHVRALNSQFASWVQNQLTNHPDELWEDGVRDYLSHATSIMDKFSDVVSWIKENNSKGDTLSKSGLEIAENRLIHTVKDDVPNLSSKGNSTVAPPISFSNSWSSGPSQNSQVSFGLNYSNSKVLAESKSSEVKTNSFLENPTFTSSASAPSLGNTWSLRAFPNSPAPIFSGFQNSGFTKPDNASSDKDDGEEEPEKPSSPSVKKAEEEGIVVVHEAKCKLYVKSTDPVDKGAWKDKGLGGLTIKCKAGVSKGTKESMPTVVIRNNVGKILLNALLYPGIKTSLQKNAVAAIFHSADNENNENVSARTYLIRTKSEEDRNRLDAAIKEYSPS